MKTNKNISNLLIIIPFILVYMAEIIQFSYKDISSILKLLALLYMIVFIILKQKINFNLLFALIIFIPFLIYGIKNTFLLKAGLEEGIKYLFPISVLFYSYTIRDKFTFLLKLAIFFVLLNDFWQIINYYYWLKDENQWFYLRTWNGIRYYNATAGILRATGIVVFFGLFGFINAVSFFLVHKYYNGKYKTAMLGIFVISLLLSFSFKSIGAFLFVLFMALKKRIKILGITLAMFLIALLSFPDKMIRFIDSLLLRIRLYITQGNSARAESYRVMFRDIGNGDLLGHGVGSFGGATSTKYHSPVYELLHFNWYKTTWIDTTDTFYPHVFIELGILGGLAFFLVLLIPLYNRVSMKKMKLVYIIYFLLFFDALFSFSLKNLAFLLFSLIFVYPIIYFEKQKSNVIKPID